MPVVRIGKGLSHLPHWRMSIIVVTKETKPGHVNTVILANAKSFGCRPVVSRLKQVKLMQQ